MFNEESIRSIGGMHPINNTFSASPALEPVLSSKAFKASLMVVAFDCLIEAQGEKEKEERGELE